MNDINIKEKIDFFDKIHKNMNYRRYVDFGWVCRVGDREIICFEHTHFNVYAPVQPFSACACYLSGVFSWYSLQEFDLKRNNFVAPSCLSGVSLYNNNSNYIRIGSPDGFNYIVNINDGILVKRDFIRW